MKIVILNKPYDVLSQFRADEKHQTMADFIDDKTMRLAGRLDMDSEGLVFLTDHGGLNQYITNPANKKFKTYMVQVEGDVTEEALEQLRKGIELKDGLTLPARAEKVSEPEWLWERNPPVRFRASVPTSWIEISICEGRNRQVRRMTSAVGFPTLRLIRTKIGDIDLVRMELKPGETKEIEPLLYPDFQNVPAEEPYRSRSYVKKPGGTGGKPMVRKNKDGSVKKTSGTKRIWQMDESEKPKRRTNGTTRPNTKAPRGRGRGRG
ncbi:pseudouridine synthase [Acinetobacter wanghuae]|uniref:Pseudouridine synthase n=1 Tax=Acinetobacter wanghuae TaxID=2662362 RepID=A0A5Q0P2P1_9GAMM|nr:rRNA large subunit pseudouridine synthase E [Acinetobacter wanghuae]MQW91086.1 pseudouridine synthase [Acinetobacter wanghuae]QGA11365.1 pseudouridine synthase [Acinetobacter wanghuae]